MLEDDDVNRGKERRFGMSWVVNAEDGNSVVEEEEEEEEWRCGLLLESARF